MGGALAKLKCLSLFCFDFFDRVVVLLSGSALFFELRDSTHF